MSALIVSYSAGPGGAERILADHAGALEPGVVVACPEGWLAGELRARGVSVLTLRPRSLALRGGPGDHAHAAARLLAHAREIRGLERSLAPTVVVAWGMRSLLAAAAARLASPLVFQHNDLLPGPAIGAAVRAAARRCALVVALSRAIADDLGVPGTRVIHPGVDLDRFAPAGGEERPSGALLLGALAPWKRPDVAIEASAMAGVPLTVAGAPVDARDEGYARGLRERAGATVTFAGQLDDPRPALHGAECLVHCSPREPFGLALVEALACGVPVAAPASGGPAEIVDGRCGALYAPGDAGAAARAIRAIVADRDALSRGARERAVASFDLRRSREAFRAAIASVAADAPDAPGGGGIAVVTVLHDSERELATLCDSLERHLPGARLVAVDSGSSDTGAELARRRGATVIDGNGNVGFGRATNLGIAAVTEPITVVLNPDVELVDSSLAALAAEARKGPERILAPLVLRRDGGREQSAHPEPASTAELVRALLPPTALPGALRARVEPSRAARPRRVAWAVGACLVARTETLRRLGPFDERTFMYAEDMELGLRAADAGVETWLCPDARVVHVGGHASERAFGGEPFELLARRRRIVVEERRGAGRARADTLLQALTFANRIALRTVLVRPAGRERDQLRAVLATRRPSP